MVAILGFLTIVVIIFVLLYFAKTLDPQLNFLKWLFILLIIPMLIGLSSIAVDNSKECVLVYNDITLIVTKVCTGEVSNVSLWILKITTWLFYVQTILCLIGLLIIAYKRMVKKGSYVK